MTSQPTRTSSAVLRAVPVLLGVAGVVGGVVLSVLAGRVAAVHVGFLVLGLVSIFGGLVWQRDTRWRDSLASLTYTFFAAVCFVALYLISANRDVAWDLTRERLHSLSPQTVSLLRALPNSGVEYRLVSLAPEADHEAIREFLDLVRREAPGLRIAVIDPDRNLTAAAQFVERPLPYDLFAIREVEGRAVRTVRSKLRPGTASIESDVANAISQSARERDTFLYFTREHLEKRANARDDGKDTRDRPGDLVSKWVQEVLFDRVPTIKDLRLMQGVPPDAAAVVIAGPARDLQAFEAEVLGEYLSQGGKVLVMIDPQPRASDELVNLEGFLERFGVRARNEFIVDRESETATRSPYAPLVVAFGDHPIAASTNQAPFLLSGSRALEAVTPPPAGVIVTPLAITVSDRVWTETMQALKADPNRTTPSDPSKVGRKVVAMAASISTPGGVFGDTGRVVVVGDSETFTDEMLKNEAALFGLQSLNWLMGEERQLAIPPRLIRSTPVVIDNPTLWAMAGVFLALGICLGAGGVTFTLLRRRRR